MKTPESNYMPQLDSLRALAVFAVMIHHWAPGFLGFGPWGDLGVRCFFVLSGFLITGILLRGRSSVENGQSTVGRQMRQFYIRRSLRIFPIYYLTLGVGVLLGMYVLRETFWWHASYGSNFYFALRGEWRGYVSHLWSLSVEEQFYLIWPALVLMLPRKLLPAFFVVCIAAALVTRAWLAVVFGPGHIALKVLLPSNLDSLVTGALLAWILAPQSKLALFSSTWLRRSFPAATLLFIGISALRYFELGKPALAIVGPLAEAFFFAIVIGKCAQGISGFGGRLLNLRALQYFGSISYGLYLYHMFAAYVAGMFANKLGLTVPGPGVGQFALFFAMSVAAAALSYRFIETPFNQLKRFFPSDGATPKVPNRSGEAIILGHLPKTAA